MVEKKKITLKSIGPKRLLLLLAAGLALLVLSLPGDLFGSITGGTAGQDSAEQGQAAQESNADTNWYKEYEEMYQTRLEEILSGIEGVGEVSVMITLSSSSESILQTDTDSEQYDITGDSGSSESRNQESVSTVIINQGSDDSPIVVKELVPTVEGVVVVCEGGGSSIIKTEISEAVMALFNLSAHKIKVLKKGL